jgi:CHAT domain-containing protein
MEHLYRARVEGGLSKAEALRRAQLALLRGTSTDDPARRAPGNVANSPRGLKTSQGGELAPFSPPSNAPWAHPYYWAPFILIGNAR